MDPVRNPFAPGAGYPPPELAGRQAILEQAEVTLGRAELGRHAKSLILVGLRGVGKTVLLNRILQMAEQKRFKALLIEAPEDKTLRDLLLPPLRQILLSLDRMEGTNEKVKRAMRVLKSFAKAVKFKYGDVELSVEPETGAADSGDLETDLPELLMAVGEAAQARKTAVALLVDEMQYLSDADFSALIIGIHKVGQRQLPLVLFGAGLPQLVGLAGRSKSYAERLFDFPILGPLGPDAATVAIVDPIEREGERIEPKAVAAIVSATEGYPYFLQAWGSHCWIVADKSPIKLRDVEAATPMILDNLDTGFFRVRFDRLTPTEKRYMRAMAECGPGPHRSGDVSDKLGVKVSTVAPIRSSLIRKGMVYSPAHGDTAFTVPLFDQFLKRQMPTFSRESS
jgi:hypothetical protein